MKLYEYWLGLYPLDWEFCFMPVQTYKNFITEQYHKNPTFYNISAGSIEKVLAHIDVILSAAMEDWNNIVLLETMKAADKDHRVFKLQFEAGEFDMVIYDQKENSCEIFEIKHSSKQVPFQYRHLVDEDKCQRTERRFGPIHGRYILYRGEDAQMENGVQYWNVENYLKALPTLDIVQVQEIGMQSIEPTL